MKIVFLDRYSLGDVDLSPIEKLGECISYEMTLPSEVTLRCKEADVVITNKVKLTQTELEQLPKLKLICVAATGVNNIDLEAAQRAGITVRNVPGYSTQSVVESTFTLALGLHRQILYYDQFIKSGAYSASGRIFHLGKSFGEWDGKNWGIIGMGHIGHGVAKVAEAFGAHVMYYSTSGKNTQGGYPCLPLNELLRKSDVVSIHAPLNAATQRLLTLSKFQIMKPSAIVINVARGGIVDEADMATALNQNLIAGYGADVFEEEPLQSMNTLLKVKDQSKLLLSPHIAWASAEARQRLVDSMSQSIREKFGK